MTKYFKGVVKFYGVRSPDVRKVVATFKPEILALKSLDVSFDIAEELMASEYQEDKVRVAQRRRTNFFAEICDQRCSGSGQTAAVDVLYFNLKQLNSNHMPRIEKFFDRNLVYDWCARSLRITRVLLF